VIALLLGAPLARAQWTNQPPMEPTTIQVGGYGNFVNMSMTTLRCAEVNHAIIGVRSRKGTVVDFLRIGCAPVVQSNNGLSWAPGSAYWPAGTGNPEGGSRWREANCPTGYAMAGFIAGVTQDNRYLQDVRFECARIAGIGAYPLQLPGFPSNASVQHDAKRRQA
jgi:hypothetical protein